MIENHHQHLLMLKRSKDTSLGPGLWGFPAGHIKAGEDPAHCAIREMHEEIGRDIIIYPLNEMGPVRDTFYGGKYEIFLFHFRWHNGTIHLNHEHTEYAWVSPEQYCNYDVMPGLDEDIALLKIWPVKYLNPERLPDYLKT